MCAVFSPGCCNGFLPLLEDAVYPVGLGEQRGVAETHPQAQEDPPERAHAHVRRGDHQERDGVTQEDARQQHVAHLAAGRSHDGRVVVPDEGDDDEGGGDDAQHGDEDGEDGPGGVPLQLDDGDGHAAGAVDIGPHLIRTQLTGELWRLEEGTQFKSFKLEVDGLNLYGSNWVLHLSRKIKYDP